MNDGVRDGSGEMFDAIAGRYDAVNRIVSLGIDQSWRRATVAALELPEHGAVLDVATGTSDMAILIARRHPGATVVGIDPSKEMLRVGEEKIAKAGLEGRVALQVGTGEDLPFEDGRFDGVTIAFGIRNCVDRPRALREMARVTRPGGRIAVLELSEPRGFLGPLARFHIHTVVPALGAALSGKREYRYLERSIAAFPSPDEFAATIRASGLDVIAVRPLTFGVSCLFVATPTAPKAT